ncbi:hypothetical protein K474DRAFT_1708046 [Panus rudis PR-1116 ss-1]|nr:hypothetical protein K474DRAFT_1708046 [Panus rudis PR-1116 ss-1]
MPCTYSNEQAKFLARCKKEIPYLATAICNLRQRLREVTEDNTCSSSEFFHKISDALDQISQIEHLWTSLGESYVGGSRLLGEPYPTQDHFKSGEELILATQDGQDKMNAIGDYLQEDFRDFVEEELEEVIDGEVLESVGGGLFALGDMHNQLRLVLVSWRDDLNHKQRGVFSVWLGDVSRILQNGLEILVTSRA